jgi:hypothetical protein
MSVISGQETSFMHGLYEIAMDLIQQNILPACNVILLHISACEQQTKISRERKEMKHVK